MRLLLLGLMLIGTACVADDEDYPDPLYGFVVGPYALVGKQPDNGATYSGRATLRYLDGQLVLAMTIDGKTRTAIGKVEVAAIARAKVLRFTWPGHYSTCLAHSDLDNNARLTCYWQRDGVEHKEPGMESYFPTATWPENRQ
ncbi:hypothetical protein [Pseudomonas donghuensis]|uniref:hypothetical protein n=1 Tax=Pseudomonas donghuensis TaxID=1163398 RepID=UPI002E163FCB|nr:hypothetical protein VP780_15805 [Pseudomonas donghuensis]